jgi:DNA repair exonuclease SbcCD ATPase subunit
MSAIPPTNPSVIGELTNSGGSGSLKARFLAVSMGMMNNLSNQLNAQLDKADALNNRVAALNELNAEITKLQNKYNSTDTASTPKNLTADEQARIGDLAKQAGVSLAGIATLSTNVRNPDQIDATVPSAVTQEAVKNAAAALGAQIQNLQTTQQTDTLLLQSVMNALNQTQSECANAVSSLHQGEMGVINKIQ